MKHIKIWSLLTMTVLAMTSCGGSDDKGVTPDIPGNKVTVEQLAGEWHLASWNSNNNIVDVYISFGADGTFDLYQLAYHAGYDHYTGRYSLERDGDLLTGVYSDDVPWATSYVCRIDDAGTTLNLVSQNNEGISIYTKTAIPDDVKNSVITKAAADENGDRWL